MGFQQALSGLNAASRNLDVIGNNIANANTIGSKSSRAEFQDMYAASFSGGGSGSVNVGIGVNPGVVAQQFTQGNITSTGNPLDLAINGGGFFELTDGKNPAVYSRNGQFKVDTSGFIVNNANLKLLGYAADSTGTIIPGIATPIQLPTSGIAPVATTTMSLELNTDSRVGRPSGITVAPAATADLERINTANPATYNNATSTTVYDVKGQPVTMTYYFQKYGADKWNVYATANGQSITGVTGEATTAMRPIGTIKYPSNGGNPTLTGGGSIDSYAWSAAGVVTTTNVTDGIITLPPIPSVTLTSGGASEIIPAFKANLSTVTEYGAEFGVTALSVNGNAPGALTSVNIGSDGVLQTRYSNGQTKVAGKIELATFRNAQGLQPLGGNAWAQSSTSGTPIVNTPGQGNLGMLQSGAVEESNVDLTAELVNMMTAQRSYQANAQTIKTQDQVMSTLVNLR
jgi:flagellar hook protein FlgE